MCADMPTLNTTCIPRVNAEFMAEIYTVFMPAAATPLDRLMEEAARRNWRDAELCRRLKISQQRLNNWKSRGLPIEGAVLAAQKLSMSLDFLLFGKPAPANTPSRATEPLTLYSITPDRQGKLLDLFDQLTPAQQDGVLRELEAHVEANLAVVKHFTNKRFRPALDERIEETFGLPGLNTKAGSSKP